MTLFCETQITTNGFLTLHFDVEFFFERFNLIRFRPNNNFQISEFVSPAWIIIHPFLAQFMETSLCQTANCFTENCKSKIFWNNIPDKFLAECPQKKSIAAFSSSLMRCSSMSTNFPYSSIFLRVLMFV